MPLNHLKLTPMMLMVVSESSDWYDTGADDEKSASEIEDQEKEHHSSASEDEGEWQYREAKSKGVCSKVITSISTRGSVLTLCLISCPRKVMPHVTHDCSFARTLVAYAQRQEVCRFLLLALPVSTPIYYYSILLTCI